MSEDIKKLKKGEKTTLIEALTREDLELQAGSLEGVLKENHMPPPQSWQVHVLVVVPEGATSEHDLLSLLREASARQMRLEMRLEQVVASLPHKQPKSYSDAALGQLEMGRLKEDQLIIEVSPTGDGDAFWSEEMQIQADAITNEAVFDAFITPFFSTILHTCGLVFVNSERYQWLSQSTHVTKNTDFKPVGFATHRGMYRSKPQPKDEVIRPSEFRFGVAEEELFDCLIIFESKLTITDAAFGQVVRYLQNLLPEASASAILFDRRSFWLIKSHNSVVVKVQTAMWTNNGSKSLFKNFISNNVSPWVSRLTLACMCLGVDVVEGDAFLGRGAHGRVFKVIRQNGGDFALKIVGKCSVGRLYREKEALMRAQHTGLTTTLVGELIETPESAALLLSPVGKPLPHPRTQQEVRSLFRLLWQLHASGLVHGDPRVPNVILHRDKLLWIDLMEVLQASSTLKRFDAEILTRSTLSVSRTIALDSTLVQLIDYYGESATGENIDRLAEAVYQNLCILN
ncbi:unnamed protein product [Phytophthora fragariaefolia]|uniref:Unnamed protein product n=1 Tax=Phytophthora fragariaefolia TaxID=1490495 RepID=A0A9W6YCB5_9STRA|nr:unnamed protein product [Phytophthora fragariaefolia]